MLWRGHMARLKDAENRHFCFVKSLNLFVKIRENPGKHPKVWPRKPKNIKNFITTYIKSNK